MDPVEGWAASCLPSSPPVSTFSSPTDRSTHTTLVFSNQNLRPNPKITSSRKPSVTSQTGEAPPPEPPSSLSHPRFKTPGWVS